VAGIPLLVRDPAAYLRAERAALVQAASGAWQRRARLADTEPYAGLPEKALERHRDVLAVEAAQAATLLSLLRSGDAEADSPATDSGARHAARPGWRFETLVPYLLRDWTNASELAAASARIGAALKLALPEPRDKLVVFAGCGAGGLLAGVAPEFTRLIGFDLTLPILAAARRLLDCQTLTLALPRVLNPEGRITLARREAGSSDPRVELVAMDALDTALADGSVNCAVTVFLTDILPDPQALAAEIHRVLATDGVWINYGPSGNNLKAVWHFDETEGAAFFHAAGFLVEAAEAQRTTNLDISGVCPSISFRSAVCYLTLARKARKPEASRLSTTPQPKPLWTAVPLHFPGARMIHRLDSSEGGSVLLQHDRIAGREESWRLSGKAARIMTLVDGKRTAGDIAGMLSRRTPPEAVEDTLRILARSLDEGLLDFRSAQAERGR
jgi:SAM-dependent methyltransferase